MAEKKSQVFGLIGTITRDSIYFPSGRFFSGLGGILYQAAALCGLGKKVYLFSNIGEEVLPHFKNCIRGWTGCEIEGVYVVPGQGHRVRLRYPKRGERVEVLESSVPPFDPKRLIDQAGRLDFLIGVVNSGRDFTLSGWRQIVRSVRVPIWLDIHSLPLSFVLNQPRHYQPLVRWKDWVAGISYLQANEREVACMLGEPKALPSLARIKRLGREALALGLKTVFITLGKKGVLVMAPGECQVLPPPIVRKVVDTTGCGDVFCAGTVVGLASGADPVEAARLGIRLAAGAARVAGVEKTYAFIRNWPIKTRQSF